MEVVMYFIIGFIVTCIGAIPLGTVNISVIHTTLNYNMRNAMKIAFAAGIAEIVLSFYALHCSTTVTKFIDMNQWIQFIIATSLFIIGGILFFKKKNKTTQNRHAPSHYLTGLFLGLLNPPVLVYWLFIISYLNEHALQINMHSSLPIIVVFFLGVYLGKVVVLYSYSRISILIKNKVQHTAMLINRFIGALLVIIGSVQLLNYFL